MKRIAVFVAALMALAAPAWASYDTGWYAYTAGDFALAHSEWRPLAEAGDARAQYQLGLMYQKGEGVDADPAEAARLFGLAAGQGHSPSSFNLAQLYYTGNGVPRDHGEAARLAEQAAKLGNAEAQFFLGALYQLGHGVPADLVESHVWLSLAAMRGSKSARERRTIVEGLMTQDQLAEAEAMRQAALGGN